MNAGTFGGVRPIVTHDEEEALEISEHVVVMFDRRVAQAGAPRQIYDQPSGPRVATFLGANVLRAAGESGAAGFVRPENVKTRSRSRRRPSHWSS